MLYFHISILELYPIFLFMEILPEMFRNKTVLFHCDNSAVVEILNKQTSKDTHIMRLLRKIVLLSLKFNINIIASHIPGKYNIIADRLSRGQVNVSLLTEWGLKTRIIVPPHLLPTPALVPLA